jgi:hypothetical protein
MPVRDLPWQLPVPLPSHHGTALIVAGFRIVFAALDFDCQSFALTVFGIGFMQCGQCRDEQIV